MTAFRTPILLCLAAVFAACEGAAPWTEKLQANELYKRTNGLKVNGPCALLVPLEYNFTFPIPLDAGARTIEVLYYAKTPGRYAPKHTIMTPQFAGILSWEDPAKDRCVALHPQPFRELQPPISSPYLKTAYARRLFQAFDRLQKTSMLYFGRQALNPDDRKVLEEFAISFPEVAEPALLSHYYRVNPDFWEWLRQETGRSIPKSRED